MKKLSIAFSASCPLSEILCYHSLPQAWMEEDQKWEQFQPSGEHIEHQDPLGESCQDTEITGRAYLGKSGAYII